MRVLASIGIISLTLLWALCSFKHPEFFIPVTATIVAIIGILEIYKN